MVFKTIVLVVVIVNSEFVAVSLKLNPGHQVIQMVVQRCQVNKLYDSSCDRDQREEAEDSQPKNRWGGVS